MIGDHIRLRRDRRGAGSAQVFIGRGDRGLGQGVEMQVEAEHGQIDEQTRKDICRAFQEAIVEVLVSKSLKAPKTKATTMPASNKFA